MSKDDTETDLIWPTDEEDAAITAAALSDPDSRPWTDEEWERARPTMRFGAAAATLTRERLDIPSYDFIIQPFRATGAGWENRVNAALYDWLRDHSPADLA